MNGSLSQITQRPRATTKSYRWWLFERKPYAENSVKAAHRTGPAPRKAAISLAPSQLGHICRVDKIHKARAKKTAILHRAQCLPLWPDKLVWPVLAKREDSPQLSSLRVAHTWWCCRAYRIYSDIERRREHTSIFSVFRHKK